MWRALGVTLLFSSTAAIAATEAEARSTVIWNEPLPLMLTPLGYSGLAFGTNIPVHATGDLVVEVMPFRMGGDCDPYCDGLGVFAAVGWAYKVLSFGSGGNPRDGLFLQPKLIGHFGHHNYFADSFPELRSWSVDDFSLACGVDIGYRMTFGHFFIAPVLGASVGWVNRLQDYSLRFLPLVIFDPNGSPWNGPVIGFDLNVHLLRLGLVF